jgi:hypothetical protein
MENTEFTKLSYNLTKKVLTKKEKSTEGIFFTPKKDRQRSIDLIKEYQQNKNITIKDILEPSCGSCEFVRDIDETFKDVTIDAIEYNTKIYEEIKNLKFTNKVNIYNKDYLSHEGHTLYDLIFGNPPYFVMKKGDIDKKYWGYFVGRPNIFIIFIIHSLFKLKDGGILSFILPKNFLNCSYYDNMRKYIYETCNIIAVEEGSGEYIETSQGTIIFIIQKQKGDNSKYSLLQNNFTIFNTHKNIQLLNKLYEGSSNLDNLNCGVSVGNVVWNQEKEILTDNWRKTRLIYNSDIVNGKLKRQKYKNESKKNYIHKEGSNKPVVVVSRGYAGGEYNFEYCLIRHKNYVLENHIIAIKYKGDIDNETLLPLLKKIIKSFKDPRTKEFINIYFSNNAMNTTELQYILPIYV